MDVNVTALNATVGALNASVGTLNASVGAMGALMDKGVYFFPGSADINTGGWEWLHAIGSLGTPASHRAAAVAARRRRLPRCRRLASSLASSTLLIFQPCCRLHADQRLPGEKQLWDNAGASHPLPAPSLATCWAVVC